METLIHEQYLDSAEWQLLGGFRKTSLVKTSLFWPVKPLSGYKYYVEEVTSLINKKKFSTLHVNFMMKRNESYYSLTLFIPILVMTLLSPCGLILPVDAGEKMGLQVWGILCALISIK